jgi:hypothetical protein
MLEKHLKNHKYTLTEESHEDINYFYAKISHPNNEERDIGISTYGKELTLFIWKHHEHHDSFEEDDHEQKFLDLCEYIDDIISDKVFFSAGYKDDRVVYVSINNELEEILDNKVDRIEIISWSGEQDQIIENEG